MDRSSHRQRSIPEAEDAIPHAEVAPVDEEDENQDEPEPLPPVAQGPEKTQRMRLEREARDLAAKEGSRVAAHEKTAEGAGSGSVV